MRENDVDLVISDQAMPQNFIPLLDPASGLEQLLPSDGYHRDAFEPKLP
jgi:hypothetical protein